MLLVYLIRRAFAACSSFCQYFKDQQRLLQGQELQALLAALKNDFILCYYSKFSDFDVDCDGGVYSTYERYQNGTFTRTCHIVCVLFTYLFTSSQSKSIHKASTHC